MMNFIAQNWVNMLLVIVGTFAFITYILQERKKKIDAASLIIIQIDEVQERLREIAGYIVEGQLNEMAFYESLPLLTEDYWNKYKHYFVRDMDTTSYSSLNQLYNYISEVQEQQLLMKEFQKSGFHITQTVLANIETQFIISGLTKLYGNITPHDITSIMGNMVPSSASETDKDTLNKLTQQMVLQNPNFDANQFWNFYLQQQGRLKYIINQKALTMYIPVQIRISLEKILKAYSMLEITGTDGYQFLKKMSKKKF